MKTFMRRGGENSKGQSLCSCAAGVHAPPTPYTDVFTHPEALHTLYFWDFHEGLILQAFLVLLLSLSGEWRVGLKVPNF